jgi:hypothetical protein
LLARNAKIVEAVKAKVRQLKQQKNNERRTAEEFLKKASSFIMLNKHSKRKEAKLFLAPLAGISKQK